MRLVISVMATFTIIASCCLTGVAQEAESGVATTTKATMLITGLHCPPCTRTVESGLRRVKGVKAVKVDWKTKNARVEFDESLLPVQALAERIAATPHMMGGGMHYGAWLAVKVPNWTDSTAEVAQLTLKEVAGVKKVVSYPAQKSLGIQFDTGSELTIQHLIDALAKADIEVGDH